MKIKLLFIAIIATFKLFSQIPAYVPTTGLVGWFPFNGNSNDYSSQNNNGTNFGATLTSDRFGNINSAYDFNGINNYISVNDNSSLQLSSSFTISIWHYDKTLNIDSWNNMKIGTLLSKVQSNQADGFWINALNTNSGVLSCSNNSKTTQQVCLGNSGFSSLTCIDTNNWKNLICTFSNGSCKIYLNGVLVNNSTTTISNVPLNNYPMFFGFMFQASQSAYYHGKIDDIGIWNRALTTQEITNLYLGCNINPIIPIVTNASIGQNSQITSSNSNCQYVWESNSNDLGWTVVPSNSRYSNVTTNSLSINNIQVSNHLQEFRVIVTQGNCVDTSNVSTIIVNDTCLNTVNDTVTTHITVTDTLLINVAFAGLTPPNNSNTIKVYPNPANDFVIIDNGNFAMMSGYSVKITNSLGATVFNSPINQAVFNVSTTTFGARGVYYIHILNSNNAIIDTREIVLQ